MRLIDFNNTEEKRIFDEKLFQDPHSFVQQTTMWAENVCPISSDVPVFVYKESDHYYISASLYLYQSSFGNILVSNVQAGSLGCFTFIGDKEKTDFAYQSIINDIIDFAKKNNCISVTVTSNPYSHDDLYIYKALQPQTGMKTFISILNIEKYFTEDGHSLFMDLNSKKRSGIKRNIKKAYKSEFNFHVCSLKENFDWWYENIHTKRTKELHGEPLPKCLFDNIMNNKFFEPFYKFFYVTKKNNIVAGDFCIFSPNGNFDNFMMSADSGYFKEGINYYLVDNILKWCFQNNIKIYNWQSSNPPDGGIFNFKRQWGSKVLPYQYITKILNVNALKALQQSYSFEDIMQNFKGHFFVPYHTLKANIYDFLDKTEINRLANIYQK